MKFETQYKPWEAASKDSSRPVLTAVHLTIDGEGNGWLDATDSYMLVRVPCDVEPGDVAGLIPREALIDAAKSAGRATEAHLTCNGSVTDSTGRTWTRPAGQFPDVDRIIGEEPTTTLGMDGAATDAIAFGIDPLLLAKAAKAMGAKRIRIAVASPLKPVRVTSLSGYAGRAPVAVLMPIRLAS